MSLAQRIEHLQFQILSTKKMLELTSGHPLMSSSFEIRLKQLESELSNLPLDLIEPEATLLFSGNAVLGSIGIKADFLGKILCPFQEMVKTQAALVRFGKVAKRGIAKKSGNTNLFLTALPVGSFGVKLSQLENEDLFDSSDISSAIKQVLMIVKNSSESDEKFESLIESTPRRSLTNLQRFLKEIVNEKSIFKAYSGELGIDITEEDVSLAYLRVAETYYDSRQLKINGILRGFLLDSGRFEILDESQSSKHGFISEDLDEEEIVKYGKDFLNKLCEIHLTEYKAVFKNGKTKIQLELNAIREH